MSTGRSSPEAKDRAVDRLTGGYLLLSASALILPGRPDVWPALAAGHLLLAGLLLTGSIERLRRDLLAAGTRTGQAPGARAGRHAVRVILDWYPLLLMPFLYWELPYLNTAVWHGRFFDGTILGWEEGLFHSQPSLVLATRWSSRAVSELLHAAYLAYFPAVYLLPAALYLKDRTRAFEGALFALMLGFTAHYVVFILFPVQGPRYLFPRAHDAGAGPLLGLARSILETGSSRGTAFPSTHVAIATVQTGNAIRFLPRWAPVLALITAGIALGAIYGGFHYATDALVGVLTGALVALAAPTLRRGLTR